jgi:CRISPR/Cas system-associated endoribonuclease Cas2
MAIRYVTYDISEDNSYDDLYKLLDKLEAEEITKSTYKIESSSLNLDDLCEQLKNATQKDDHVAVIFRTEESIAHRKVR